MAYIDEEMPPETPLAFGLHPNAEIGFKLREGMRFCSSIAALHPQSIATAGGLSTEERVCGCLLNCTVVIYCKCPPTIAQLACIYDNLHILSTPRANAGKGRPGRTAGKIT